VRDVLGLADITAERKKLFSAAQAAQTPPHPFGDGLGHGPQGRARARTHLAILDGIRWSVRTQVGQGVLGRIGDRARPRGSLREGVSEDDDEFLNDLKSNFRGAGDDGDGMCRPKQLIEPTNGHRRIGANLLRLKSAPKPTAARIISRFARRMPRSVKRRGRLGVDVCALAGVDV
jgi:hypothetical protein